MEIRSADADSLQIEEQELRNEGEIHDFIEKSSGVAFGDLDVLIINSEQSTRTGVRADILGLAETGHPVVIELKQDGSGRKGSRTALIQALEYAADFRSQSYQDLSEKYANYSGSETPLNAAHAEYFDLNEPLSEATFTMATEPRIVLLAEDFQASDVDAARYLRDANDVDITCIEVTPFEIEESRVYGFECRLESKVTPSTPRQDADDEALPWLIKRMEESYFERFGEDFGIQTSGSSSERAAFHKGTRFVSRQSHPDDFRYSFKISIFGDSPNVEFGVSPRGNEQLEEITDRNLDAMEDGFEQRNTNWRRIRNGGDIQPALLEAGIETVSPEISETVGRVLWESEEFQQIWQSFLSMVERWDTIIDRELRSEGVVE